jgi:hypothetical protein
MSGRRGRNPLPFVVNPARFSSSLTLTREFGGADSRNSGNITLTLPVGAAGQMLVAIIGSRAAAGFSLPSGWTAARQITNANTTGGGPVSFLYAYKVRAPGEPTPTFSRTGGSVASGWLLGYTPSAGALAFGSVSGITGGATSTITIPTFSPAAARNLIVAACTTGTFWDFPQSGFSAASLAASAASGTLVAFPSGTVSSAEWGNVAWTARTFGAASVGTQIFDLWDAPAGATGQMSVSAPFGAYEAAAVSFTWSP